MSFSVKKKGKEAQSGNTLGYPTYKLIIRLVYLSEGENKIELLHLLDPLFICKTLKL
jgi:hypothetical protein